MSETNPQQPDPTDNQAPNISSTSKSEWDFTLKLSLGSDGDDQSDDAGKSTSSSHRFSSPNPSEQDDTHGDKKIKRRKVEHSLSADETTPKSGRQQHFPLSERQQLALVMQQTLSGSAKSPTHPQTPSSGGKTRGKQPKIYRRNDKGESLLHVASKRGDKRSAKSLIRQGADVNAVDYAGWTPLHESCNHGFYETAKLLIKHGANVNVCGLEKDTPLHDAAISGNVKLVLLLLKHGAEIDSVNAEGQKPVDVANDPEVIKLLTCDINDLSMQLATIANSPTSSSTSASDDDFETDVNSTPKSFSSPLPSPPYASDCGQEGKAKIHSPKTPQAGNSAKEIPPEAGKLKTDPAEPTLPTGNELEKTEASDKSPSQNQEDLGDKVKLPTAEKDELQESPNLSEEATPVADVQPEDQLDIPSNTSDPNSQAETPKTSIKRELKKTQPKKLIAQTAGKLLDPSLAEQSPQGESRRSGRPPRASFKSRMDNAATSHQQEKPKSESTRGRRAQKSKKRKSDHDVYEFHSSDSEDEGLIPTVVSKFANFNENCSNSSTTTGCVTTTTAKVVSSTTLTPAVQPKKNGQESLSIVPIMKPTEDKKSCKEEEKFPPPKTAFEIAISESFESSRSFVGSTGRGRGKHLRFLKPKRKMAEDLSGKMEEIDSAVPQIIDSPKSEIQADKVEEIKPEDPIMVIKNEELESCAVETTNSVEPVESDPLDTAALSPSISEAQKDDAEVAAISSNSVAIGDRSDSDTPSSSQSDASLKVPPLRIVFPTTSRSNSAVSEADVVSHSVTVGVSSVAHRGERLPYVVKLKEDGSGGQVEGIEDGRSLDTSEASDDESGSAAHTNDGTQSESDLSRSTQDVHAGLGVNRKNAGGHTKRVTRSQARRGGHAESRTKETTTAVTSEASDGLQSANDLESAHHVHPRKRKYHRKEIHAVVSSETSSTNPTWTLTSSVATTSEAVRSDPPETHPSTSTLSANDLTSVSCYEGFRELRMRVESKWQLQTEPITYERPSNFDKFWINTKEYVTEGKPERITSRLAPAPSFSIEAAERLFNTHEAARHSLRQQHQIERERLRIVCEKEVIRAYNRHSRVQVGQPPDSPFSFVRMLYDADIYNPLELEKSTAPQTQSATNDSQNHQPNATDKPLGVWVDEVMERFRKRKAEAIARHQMECDSLSAVQRMEWEGMLKRLKASGVTTHLPQQYDSYVPAVEIIRDFVILPQ